MARIIESPVITRQTSGTTVVPSFGSLVFVADDYILIKVTNRQTSGTSITATGYTKPAGANTRNGNVSECWLYKKAVGGDTAPTINIESAQVIVKVYRVLEADTTTFLSATPAVQNWSSVTSFNHSTYSNGAGDLVIFSASSGTGLLQPRMKAAKCTALNYQAQTSNCDAVEAYRQITASGTTEAVTTYMNASGSGQAHVLVIKNGSSGTPQIDLRTAISELNWYGTHGSTHQAVTWEAPSAFAASINGITCSTTAPTIGTSTAVPTNMGIFSLIRSTESTASLWVGGSHTITSADLTGLLFSLQWFMSTSSTLTRYGAEGIIIGLSDGTNYVTYRIANPEKGWLQTTLDSIVFAPGNAVVYASSGSINLAAVTRVAYLWHRAGSSGTSDDLYIRNALLIPTTLATTPAYSATVTGGDATNPATAVNFYRMATAWDYLGLATLQGANQVLSKIDCAFGDGTNPTYVDDSAFPISFPGAYSATRVDDWQMNWNVNTLAVAVATKPKAGDTINLIATAIVAPNKQLMVIDSGSDTGATVSLAGSSIVGMKYTDNAGFSIGTGTFKSGGTVTVKASQTGLNVSKTVGAVPAMAVTANSKTLTSCTIDVTGTSATYHLSLSSSVTAITLNTVTLSGTPATDKIYSELASGTLTITTNGLGTALVAGDVTFIGGSTATAVIASPQVYQKVTVTGITTGARVQIYDTTSSTELFNGTATAGNTVVTGGTVVWTDPVAASANRAIRIRVSYVSGVTAKNFIETSGLTCGQTSGTAEITYPVSPTDDTVYNANGENGSTIYGGGEITFVDASPDRVEMNMTASTLSLQKQYAAWAYYAFTATGIATDIDYINAIDTANYEFTSIRWKNTATAPATLTITGGYAWDSSTGLAITLVDTSGGTIFLMPDHVVAYATGSGVTAQDVADIAAASATSTTTAVLSAAQTTPIHADIRKVNNHTVDGVGSDADPWGPA